MSAGRTPSPTKTPSTPLLTAEELAGLNEIAALLDEAYRHYFATTDGYCKSAEGAFSVSFGTYFDRNADRRERGVEVYSYALGPSRTHYFDSISEALVTVRDWHAEEMSRFCGEGCEGPEHDPGCFVAATNAPSQPSTPARNDR